MNSSPHVSGVQDMPELPNTIVPCQPAALAYPRFDPFNLVGKHPDQLTGITWVAHIKKFRAKYHDDIIALRGGKAIVDSLRFPTFLTYQRLVELAHQCGKNPEGIQFVFETYRNCFRAHTQSTFNPNALERRNRDEYIQPVKEYYPTLAARDLVFQHNMFVHPRPEWLDTTSPSYFLDEFLVSHTDLRSPYEAINLYTSRRVAQGLPDCYCTGPAPTMARSVELGNIPNPHAHPPRVPRTPAGKGRTGRYSSPGRPDNPVSVDNSEGEEDIEHDEVSSESEVEYMGSSNSYTPSKKGMRQDEPAPRSKGYASSGRKPSVFSNLQDARFKTQGTKRSSSGLFGHNPKVKKTKPVLMEYTDMVGGWREHTNTVPRAPARLGLQLGEVFDFKKLVREYERQTLQSIHHPYARRHSGKTSKDVIWVGAWIGNPKQRNGENPNRVEADRRVGPLGNKHFIHFTSVSMDCQGNKVTGGQAMKFKDITLMGPWVGGSEDWVKWMVTQLLLEIKSNKGKHDSKDDDEVSDNSEIEEA